MKYNFNSIENKWQKRWEEKRIFSVREDSKKKKYYVLEMFPYPSGSGLHMGHAFNYTVGDIQARFKRMQGYNVLYPMGYDSLGLPAENAAIKSGVHPRIHTEKAIKNFIKQQRALGLSYDWERVVMSHDPNYFRWDQWIFLKMFEMGLAYKKKSQVNWCDKCETVLANEQVHNGKCWRHEDTSVVLKELDQWFFKITDYAEELYDNIDFLEKWPERIKVMQRNWIAKKVWIDIDYEIEGTDKKITVSTTRPDTNFGATFIVVAPEHPIFSLKESIVPKKYLAEVIGYVEKAKRKSEQERLDEGRKKTGIFTGLYCVNPLNNKRMPIWVTDFVMMHVGTGAVVGVPGHDKRDFEFAKQFDLPIIRVVVGKDRDESEITKIEQVQEEHGTMINSDFLNGLDINSATKKIMDHIEKQGWGRRVVRYRLKDWLISRQRYWGTPIPIVYCDKCGVVPVLEKDLPIKLPERVKFGRGNPLESAESWIKAKCPKCKGNARRETDTMDTFVNSSWYFLRYCDSKNKKEIFDKDKVKYWMPVDKYIGGAEHACMHLIYFRFYTKFFRDLGLLKFDEPVIELFNQGMLHGNDGAVMSKSRGNVVLPEEISKKYGIDTARLFLMSIATPDKDTQWSDAGVEGAYRFVKKVVDYFDEVKIGKTDPKTESKLNKIIKEVTNQIENFKYNLAIIKIRELFSSLPKKTSKDILERSLKLLHPICPHITEEFWEKIGNKGFISLSSWPRVEEKKIDESYERAEEAIEKVCVDINHVKSLVRGKEVKNAYVYVIPGEMETYRLGAETIRKKTNLEVFVFATNDKEKHDPEGKAKKARPGKPGIYLE